MLAVDMSDSIIQKNRSRTSLGNSGRRKASPKAKLKGIGSACRTNSVIARFPAPANVAEREAIHVSHRP
jgi:hypothetical protein